MQIKNHQGCAEKSRLMMLVAMHKRSVTGSTVTGNDTLLIPQSGIEPNGLTQIIQNP